MQQIKNIQFKRQIITPERDPKSGMRIFECVDRANFQCLCTAFVPDNENYTHHPIQQMKHLARIDKFFEFFQDEFNIYYFIWPGKNLITQDDLKNMNITQKEELINQIQKIINKLNEIDIFLMYFDIYSCAFDANGDFVMGDTSFSTDEGMQIDIGFKLKHDKYLGLLKQYMYPQWWNQQKNKDQGPIFYQNCFLYNLFLYIINSEQHNVYDLKKLEFGCICDLGGQITCPECLRRKIIEMPRPQIVKEKQKTIYDEIVISAPEEQETIYDDTVTPAPQKGTKEYEDIQKLFQRIKEKDKCNQIKATIRQLYTNNTHMIRDICLQEKKFGSAKFLYSCLLFSYAIRSEKKSFILECNEKEHQFYINSDDIEKLEEHIRLIFCNNMIDFVEKKEQIPNFQEIYQWMDEIFLKHVTFLCKDLFDYHFQQQFFAHFTTINEKCCQQSSQNRQSLISFLVGQVLKFELKFNQKGFYISPRQQQFDPTSFFN